MRLLSAKGLCWRAGSCVRSLLRWTKSDSPPPRVSCTQPRVPSSRTVSGWPSPGLCNTSGSTERNATVMRGPETQGTLFAAWRVPGNRPPSGLADPEYPGHGVVRSCVRFSSPTTPATDAHPNPPANDFHRHSERIGFLCTEPPGAGQTAGQSVSRTGGHGGPQGAVFAVAVRVAL